MTQITAFSYAARYTFTAKEKDEGTGYSVTSLRSVFSLRLGKSKQACFCSRSLRRFGARYYNSDLSIWLSVDPMSDKYPSLSPYAYCANNPVKLVDPDGREIIDHDPPTSYTIKKDDTFWALEKSNELPHGTLSRINPNVNPKNLQVGQVINFAYMLGNLVVVGNDVPTGPLPNYYSQPTSSGPTMNMDNYNTLAPFLTLWNVAGMFVGNGSQYEFKGPNSKSLSSTQNSTNPPTSKARPAQNFKTPTNSPQNPPSTVPDGWRIRTMPPTQQYPKGYWRMEKPMPQGGWQGIDPSTMKPGAQHQTHISFP